MLFSEFYSSLEYDLRQRSDFPGMDSSDAKPLPPEEAMRITNEVILALLLARPGGEAHPDKIYKHVFVAATEYLDLAAAGVIKVHAFKMGNRWLSLSDGYSSAGRLIPVSSTTVQRMDRPWAPGESIKLRVTMAPAQLTEGSDTIDFPVKDIELLRKHVVMEVASIVGFDISPLYLQRAQALYSQWLIDNTLTTTPKIKNYGSGMGYRGKR